MFSERFPSLLSSSEKVNVYVLMLFVQLSASVMSTQTVVDVGVADMRSVSSPWMDRTGGGFSGVQIPAL